MANLDTLFVPHPESGLFICKTCKVGIGTENGRFFRKHLRDKHSLSNEEAHHVFEEAKEAQITFLKTHPSRSVYINGSVSTNEIVPRVPILPVISCQKSPHCSKFYTAGDAFKKHLRITHSDTKPSLLSSKQALISCQIMSRNPKHSKYFMVRANTEEIEQPPQTSPTAQKYLQRVRTRAADASLYEDGREDWSRSTFASMSHVMEKLAHFEVSIKDAALLTSSFLPTDN